MSEEFLAFAIPLSVFGASLFGSYVAGKARNRGLLAGLGVLWLAFTVFMFLAMASASGWDGLVYAIALIFGAAPAGAGLLIGSGAGLYVTRKT